MKSILRTDTHPSFEKDSTEPDQLAPDLYLASRFVIGVALMFSGVGKLVAFEPLVMAVSIVVPVSLVFVWSVLECSVGFAVLTCVASRRFRYIVTAIFCTFVCVLCIELYVGSRVCQCFGGEGMPIVIVLLFDSIVIATLFYYRNLWDNPFTLSGSIIGGSYKAFRFVIPSFLAISTICYGSPLAGIAFVAGQSVVSGVQHRHVGRVHPGNTAEASFRISNVSRRAIIINGVESSCGCVATDDLPVTLLPFSSRNIVLRLTARDRSGLQRESARLILNDSAPFVKLRVTAEVHPNL